MVFYCFLSASRFRHYSHSIRFENPRYSAVFVRPKLRCGIQTCPGTIHIWFLKAEEFAGHQIFANPDFQSKRKRRSALSGPGYTKYQPEMIFLDMFRAKNVFLWRTTSKASEHQSTA